MSKEAAYRYQLGMLVTTEASAELDRWVSINGPKGARVADLTQRWLFPGDSVLFVVQDTQSKTQPAPVLQWSLPPEFVSLRQTGLRLHLRVEAGFSRGAGPQPVEIELSTGDPSDIVTVRLTIDELGLSGFQAPGLARARNCRDGTRDDIEHAVTRAIDVTGVALAKLNAMRSDPAATSDLLNRLIPSRLSKRTAPVTDDAAAVIRTVDVLTLTRNNMLASDISQFECMPIGDAQCAANSDVVARVQRFAGRGATVKLCDRWVAGDFPGSAVRPKIAVGVGESRAFTLLHEFIHTAGPAAEDEAYYSPLAREWRRLSTDAALGMADFYAVLAWTLGK